MAYIKTEIEIAKELSEVLDLVKEIILVARKKESVAGLVDELITAIDGIGEIKEELGNKKILIGTVGYKLADIIDAIVDLDSNGQDS